MINLSENEVLCLEHDKHYSVMNAIIIIITVLQAIAVFIYGLSAAIGSSGASILVWIVGGLMVYVSYKICKFLLSLAYDLKIIRNQTLGLYNKIDDMPVVSNSVNRDGLL